MNIYIAGPFSHSDERKWLNHMIELIQKRYPDANLYIPMDYKVPGDFQKLDGTWNLANYEWARKVFEADIEHLNNSDLVFALYTGHYCSSGSIWEIGYACGKGIPVIGYIPECYRNDNVSLMVLNSLNKYLDEDANLYSITEEFLKKYNQK